MYKTDHVFIPFDAEGKAFTGNGKIRVFQSIDNAAKVGFFVDCLVEYAPVVHSRWISVKDKLPNKTSSYLVVLDGEDIDIRLFNSKEDPYQTWSSMLNKFIVLNSRGEWQSTNRVTHWMPLPELPDMEEGAE